MKDFKPPKTEYRELWRPIADTSEMYLVSDKGRVYSKHSNKFLSLRIDKGSNSNRYGRVAIAKKDYRVHRLVMNTFKPIENSDEMFVNHIDLDTTNNCISNLEWCTPRENAIHYVKNGYIKNGNDKFKGERNPSAKLTEEIVKEIRNGYAIERRTAVDIGKQYGVSNASITNILTNKTWYDPSYIPVYEIQHNPNKVKIGSSNNRSKLTEKDVVEIRKIFEDNPHIMVSVVGENYGVSRNIISDIIDRKTWSHI